MCTNYTPIVECPEQKPVTNGLRVII